MDKKRKMLLLAIFGILTIAIAILLISLITGTSDTQPKAAVKVELPDAATNDIPRAKIKAYESERKVKTYEDYLTDIASGKEDTSSTSGETSSLQATIQQQQEAVDRITKQMQEDRNGSSSTVRDRAKSNPVASTRGSSTAKSQPKDTTGKEEWQQRYDYLLEKLYGQGETQQPQQPQAQDKPETIHQPETQVTQPSNNGFITVIGGTTAATSNSPIKAATTTSQKICAGDKVQLRLLQDTPTGNLILPKNTYIYAIAKIEDNRLQLYVSSANHQSGVIPVNWAAYDTDGYKGLAYTTDDTAEQISNAAVSAMQNLVGQLASVANRTAGTIIRSTSRMGGRAAKEKQQVITLPQDYQIYLQ